MKTVKDYLDLGLVFVDSDKLLSVSNDKDSKEVCMSGLCIAHQRYCDGFRGGNAIFFYPSEWAPSSFAWRNNDGVNPEYSGDKEIELRNGKVKLTSSLNSDDNEDWSILCASSDIAKWRPVVLKSESPTASPKEDKPMKPVYTAEMHAKGELPPVGSVVDVVGQNGVELFYGEGEVNCEVLAHVENTAVIKMGYGLGCFSSNALKASDTRTDRDKAIDAALALDEYRDGLGMMSRKDFVGKLYDNGLLKC